MQKKAIYPGAIVELEFLLKQINPKRIFLVSGKKSFESCGAKSKLVWLFEHYDVVHFQNFQTNPNSKDVEKGVQLFNSKRCDLFLSVGGGSVIDMAKTVCYYQNRNSTKITRRNINNNNFRPLTHICIPTTAGSGSESTHFAVMYIGCEKYSIAHQKLLPNYVVIDSELHYSQSTYQKAVTGVDALSQAIESFWSVNSNEESLLYSEKALEIIWKFLPDTVIKGDPYAHLMMGVGSNLAGRAINIAKTTAAHALSYGFTSKLGLPHGHAVALTLPFFYEQHKKISKDNCNDKRGYDFVTLIMEKIDKIINSDKKENPLFEFFDKILLDVRASNLKIDEDILDSVILSVNQERLANNPTKVILKELKDYFIV